MSKRKVKKTTLKTKIRNKVHAAQEIHIPVEKVILYGAASYAAYNMGMAGGYIEGTHLSIGGLIAGVVVNLSLAIASTKYGSLTGKNRTKQAQLSFFAILGINVIVTGPVVFYKLPDAFLGSQSFWYFRALWSAVWPLAVDVAIVLAGAVVGGSLISLAKPKQETKPTEQPQGEQKPADVPAIAEVKPVTSQLELAKAKFFCKVPGCNGNPKTPDGSFGSQAALNAHGSKHSLAVVWVEQAVNKQEQK
jgi:hypothetical protein